MEIQEFTESGLEKALEMLSRTKSQSGRLNVYNRYTGKVEGISLDAEQMKRLGRKGYTPVENRQYDGWSGPLEFYAYVASVNGKKVTLFDYKHGKGRLDCSA